MGSITRLAMAVVLVVVACGGEDGASRDTDAPADTDTVVHSESEATDTTTALPSAFSSASEVIAALGLSGCEPGSGNVFTPASPPAESYNCGDTGEVHWFADAERYEAGLADARSQLCPRDADWKYLTGQWWAVYSRLPVEPGADDAALQIMERRAGGGAVLATFDC